MNFSLEPWQEGYIPDVAEFADNPRIAENLRDGFPQPYTPEHARAFVTECMALEHAGTQLLRAIVSEGRAIGSVGAFLRENGQAELGYWLAQPYWGRGLMTRAATLLCRQTFLCFNVSRIFATPYTANAASRRVLEKAGFSCQGAAQTHGCSRGSVCLYVLDCPDAQV